MRQYYIAVSAGRQFLAEVIFDRRLGKRVFERALQGLLRGTFRISRTHAAGARTQRSEQAAIVRDGVARLAQDRPASRGKIGIVHARLLFSLKFRGSAKGCRFYAVFYCAKRRKKLSGFHCGRAGVFATDSANVRINRLY